MEDKKIIIEELSRIKNLMVYDRSKTLNENINEGDYDTSDGKIARWLLPSGDIINGDKIKGMIPKGAEQLNAKDVETAIGVAGGLKTVSSIVGGGGGATAATAATGAAEVGAGVAAAEVGAGVAGAAGAAGATPAAAATFLGLGPVGWIALGVIGITALGVWGMTKDDDMGMITRLFDMCKTSPDRKKWKRFLTDDQARALSGKLFKAMDGLGTDEDAVYNVFKSLKSPADFCKVSDVYEKSFDESLLEALDGDFDYGWEPIATSLVDMTKNYAQSEAEDYCEKNPEECAEKLRLYCEKNPKDTKCKDVVKVGGGGEEDKMTYKTCKGNYSVGCEDGEDDDVYALQACLGLTKNGKFDKNTEKVLKDKTGKTTITNREIWKLCDDYNRNK
jgi:hypothetical protein